jgi:hypothetical protein
MQAAAGLDDLNILAHADALAAAWGALASEVAQQTHTTRPFLALSISDSLPEALAAIGRVGRIDCPADTATSGLPLPPAAVPPALTGAAATAVPHSGVDLEPAGLLAGHPLTGLVARRMAKLLHLAQPGSSDWRHQQGLLGADSPDVDCFVAADGVPSCRGDGFVRFPRRSAGSAPVSCARCVSLSYTLPVCSALKEVITDPEAWRELDPTVDSSRVIARVGPQTTLQYFKYTGMNAGSGSFFAPLPA